MRLDVLIKGRLAGGLDIADPTAPVFQYDDGYRASAGATPLSTRFSTEHAGPFSDADIYHWLLGLLPTDQRVLNSRCFEHQVPANHPLMLLSTPMGAEWMDRSANWHLCTMLRLGCHTVASRLSPNFGSG